MAHEGMTREWLEGRQAYVGASDVAGVLGMGDPRWSSPARVWSSKVGDVDTSTSVSARMGHTLEPLILAEAGRRLGGEVVHCQGEDLLLQHPEIPLAVHLDGLWLDDETGQQIPVEAKFSTGDEGRSWANDIAAGPDMLEAWLADKSSPWPAGTVVEGWYCQIQAQLLCTGPVDEGGASYAWLAAVIGARAGCQLMMGLPVDPNGMRMLRIDRDEEMGAKIMAAVPAFWERHVVNGVVPDALITAADLGAIRRSFWQHRDGAEVELPTLAGTVGDLAGLKAEIKERETEAKALEGKIRATMQDSMRAVCCDWIVTCKTTKTGARPMRIKRMKT